MRVLGDVEDVERGNAATNQLETGADLHKTDGTRIRRVTAERETDSELCSSCAEKQERNEGCLEAL